MKKIFLLVLFLQTVVFSFAERGLIKETVGEQYISKKADLENLGYENAIKVGDDHYVIAKRIDLQYVSLMFVFLAYSNPSDFILYKLDKKMNVKAVAYIPSEIEGKTVQSFSLKKFGNKICALFYFNNLKTRKQYLFAQQFNLENLEKVGETYKIGEAVINNREGRLACIYRVDVSADYRKMLITADRAYIPLSKKRKKKARSEKTHTFAYWLIDNDFNLIKGNRSIKLGKGHTIVVGQTFDNDGNMCFLGLESEKAVKPRKNSRFAGSNEGTDRSRSRLIMKIIRPDNTDKEISFAQGQYFYSAMMRLNPVTGNVAVVGLMVSGKYGANGIFTQQVNLSTGEVLVESVSKFGVDFVKSVNSQKSGVKKSNKKKKDKKEKNGPANADYIWRLVRIGACYYNDDNELIVVAQKLHTYNVTSRTGTGNSAHYTTTTYFVYGDVIAFKLNDKGAISNFGFVPHYDESTDDHWRDYSSLFTGQKLCVVNGLEACEVKFDNTSSEMKKVYTPEGFGKDYIFATTINVSDSELLQVLSQKRKLSFTLLSVETDSD